MDGAISNCECRNSIALNSVSSGARKAVYDTCIDSVV